MKDIPVNVIKENKYILAFFIHHNFNNSLSSSTFPTTLKQADFNLFFKYADFNLFFKKDDSTDKGNYGPIIILPTLSKVNERLDITKCIQTLINLFQNSNVEPK